MRWRLRVAFVLVISLGVAWPYRTGLMLEAIGVAAKLRVPVGPHREIDWSAGPARPAAAPADRPPNAVPIVADDLGWSDLSFGGGGVAGGSVPTPHDRLFWRSGHCQVVPSDGWKLQRTARPDETWLFHLRDDPTGQRNVAAQPPAEVEQLLALLAAHDAAQSEPAWPSLIEAPTPIDRTLRDPPSADDEYIYRPNWGGREAPCQSSRGPASSGGGSAPSNSRCPPGGGCPPGEVL